MELAIDLETILELEFQVPKLVLQNLIFLCKVFVLLLYSLELCQLLTHVVNFNRKVSLTLR